MSLVEAWIRTPGAIALGWTLVHSLWEGAAISLALACTLFFTRSSRVRYAAGCLAMLALLIGFGLTFTRVLGQQQIRDVMVARAIAIPPAPEGFDDYWPVTNGLRAPADYLPWLAPFWIAGVVIFHVRGVSSWIAAWRLRRIGVCCAPNVWQSRLESLAARLRLFRPVKLLESSLTDIPVAIGCIRPVILLPIGMLTGLPTRHIEMILLHELAHIRRHDYLLNLLQIFVEGILFYHPAVWWISGVIRAERENCCDDLVVATEGGTYEYAAALTALEQNRAAVREAALAATGGNLVKRIRRLLAKPESPRAALTPVFSAAILTIAVVAVMTAWQSSPVGRVPEPAVPPVTPIPAAPAAKSPAPLLAQVQSAAERAPLTNPYSKWLNQDVAYIVTDQERAVFRGLQTDSEREQFIEQFWLRRDPTPNTAINEFKEEHYRRIAYTNERFADRYVPGWKTDRGRIYIVFGPADEVESHPSGGRYQRPPQEGGGTTTTFPYELWRYRWIEDIGNEVLIEFVDPTMTGEYRMTLDPRNKDALSHIMGAGLNVTEHQRLADWTERHRRPGLQDPVALRVLSFQNPDAATARTGATVQVLGNSAALISIPLNAYGDHRISVYGRVVTRERRPAAAFEDSIQGPAPVYTKFIPVRTGSYRLAVVVKDVSTGKVAADILEFEVK